MINLSRPEQDIHVDLDSAAGVVRQFRGSESSMSVLKMLDATASAYAIDLVSCAPDDLRFRQALMQQTMALRRVFMGDDYASPRI